MTSINLLIHPLDDFEALFLVVPSYLTSVLELRRVSDINVMKPSVDFKGRL